MILTFIIPSISCMPDLSNFLINTDFNMENGEDCFYNITNSEKISSNSGICLIQCKFESI